MKRSFELLVLTACCTLAAPAAPPTPSPAKAGGSAIVGRPLPAATSKAPPGIGTSPSDSKPISIPVPPGQRVKGIKIPHFDLDGKLRMQFFADEALRIDDRQVEMARLKVELFEVDGGDLLIDLPASWFDLETQVISSRDPVRISRSDFALEGESMEFDTRTRKGVLRGKVRMKIFDRKKL